MAYIDGYLLAVPTANKEKYAAMSKEVLTIWKNEYGMVSGKECWGDEVPDGKLTSMPMAVKCEENETVVFSWAVWPDKDTRDKAWAKCEEDERFKNMTMDFDGKRMIFGGFVPLTEV